MKEKLFLFLFLILIGLIIVNSGLARSFLPPHQRFGSGGESSHQSIDKGNLHKEKQFPPYIKGIYITSWTAGSSQKMAHILDLVKQTELNAVILDIKEIDGRITFDTESSLINELGTERILIPNLKEIINKFHQENVYVIARVVVFKDGSLSLLKPEWALKNRQGRVWQDYNGKTWLDQ